MLRGRSKDRKVTPPGPVYMSSEEFANYLKNLRNGRPQGARPQPERETSARPLSSCRPPRSSIDTSRSANQREEPAQPKCPPLPLTVDSGPVSVSRRGDVKPLRPSDVVPTATYMERGQRWMEKEDAVSLREAMNYMDLKKQEEEESRIHTAAQNEASELVYQHQNPELKSQPDVPYRYRDHLRKNSYQHARSASIGRDKGAILAAEKARDTGASFVSNDSGKDRWINSQKSRNSYSSSKASRDEQNDSPELWSRTSSEPKDGIAEPRVKTYGSDLAGGRPPIFSRRRSSTKRNVSGEVCGSFTGEQIWEEPEEAPATNTPLEQYQSGPAALKVRTMNPPNRVQFLRELELRSQSTPPESTKRSSVLEIHKNPRSQSRNPIYTANTPPAANKNRSDELEVRSTEIKQATSMLLKDRSQKLPMPSAVSNKPGRPIVSFDKSWKPAEFDEKSESGGHLSLAATPVLDPAHGKTAPGLHSSRSPVPAIVLPGILNDNVLIPSFGTSTSNPSILSPPEIMIQAPDRTNPPSTQEKPSGAISSPDICRIPLSSHELRSTGNRKNQHGMPVPVPVPVPRGHWSSAGKRATVTCHQCELPISGRVVKLHGSPENFHPECFICFSCGTALESLEIRPEPEDKRKERLERISRRALGEAIPELNRQIYADDGDERLRYFCHLDWHEHFAPRCKHCKTPIMEEHMIALGQHWHYGHFFCAECGDPFEKGVSHIEKDGYAWCIKCQTMRTERRAPKCKECKLPVIGEYVQALGGEWHDSCFRCATCGGGFQDGSFFPKDVGKNTIVLCTGCIGRELKA